MGDEAKELKPDYKCEYAKSNRSKCKKCQNQIDKDVVRLGKLERAQGFDGEIYVWFHVNCFSSKYAAQVKSSDEIKGLKDLKWDDQQKLKKEFGGGDAEEEEEEEDDYGKELDGAFLEYAKSGRSSCKRCGKNIANAELRVGEALNDKYNGYTSTNFYHLACYEVPASITSTSEVNGWKILKPADKKKAEAHFEDGIKKGSKKRKEVEDEKEERSAKRRKVDNEEKKKADKLWEIKTNLKDYNTNQLRAILKHNSQDYKAGPSELISRIADGEINGALQACGECPKGILFYDADVIKCNGHVTAYTKCTFTCKPDEAKRGKWSGYPSDKVLNKLLEEIKEEYAKAKEIPPSTTTTTSSSTKAVDADLFKDMVAAHVGDIPDKDEVVELIKKYGGKVQATVTKKVTHLISLYDEMTGKQSTKVTNAIKNDIPIVSFAFIRKAVAENSLDSMKNYVIWENGAAVKVDESVVGLGDKKEKATKERKKLAVPKVDAQSDVSGGSILIDNGDVYGVMLNVTDLTHGQTGLNSFYSMQIIQHPKKKNTFSLFRKWGRVGQDGSHTEAEYDDKAAVIAEFKKIFYEKTKNTFDDFIEDNYEKKPGKFFPVELDAEDEGKEQDEGKLKKAREVLEKGSTCTLDKRVANLVKLLFDTNMFKEQMSKMKIDTKKMPVGKLSKTQIARGTAVLEEIEEELNKAKPDKGFLTDASNRFYTVIPHDFGLEKPAIIDNRELLQKRYDLLEILGDIETAAAMLEKEGKLGTHPLNQQYDQLKNRIVPVERDSEEFKRVEKYWENSKKGRAMKIDELFTVKREGEEALFSKFDSLEERKLLWHGSNVAVFAAILNGGLKIMPHAGGRVGAGLYFADMIDKSAQYLGLHGNIGLVLLNEVALGKISKIKHDDSSLKKPPKGYDSVLAQGNIMLDPKDDYLDYSISNTKHPVKIPQGKVHNTNVNGSFQHNEFLVYDQTQVHMRYLIKINWNGN